jgi:TonB family protein
VNRVVVKHIPASQSSFGGGGSSGRRGKKSSLIAWIVVVMLAAFVTGVFWWRWTSGWEELESGRKGSNSASTTPLKVPTDAMQKLLVHRVDPIYPADARQQNLQGIIALDIVVGPDGSVASTRALNGPDVLARAAMDALRWWKFQPYRVNGEPVTVETTVAVEFKR